VSDIPPDRRSSHELYEQFRIAGERKARIERQVRRRTWVRYVPGPVVGALLAFLVVGSGIAVGTKVFTSDDAPIKHDSGVSTDAQRVPGDRRVADAVAVDPAARGARWGMRISINNKGATCAAAGRRFDDRVGRVIAGTFREYPDDVVNGCADLSTAHVIVALRGDAVDTAHRTLLFGVVDRTVTGLAVVRANQDEPVAIAPDGTYLVVRPSDRAFADTQLRITRGPTTKTITLQPSG
jgi:hypothetical protein